MSDVVMIVAGESSGELYGALLAKAIKNLWPEVCIVGVGGERMKDAGVELFAGISSAFGLAEALSSYRTVRDTFNKTGEALKKFSPAVVVLIDYPDFNIKVAKVAKTLGIKVLYYVSPQVWAWRKGRVKTITEVADRIAVILPFEEGIYSRTGIQCEFVGHPILEEIGSLPEDRTIIKKTLGLRPELPVLSLLPGSRAHELNSLFPVMIDVVGDFKKEFPHYQFFVPIAPNVDIEKYSTSIGSLEKEGVIVKKGDAIKALAVSDMAVIASGTATLQAAFLETPMVVVYKLFPLTYLIGRLMVDVKYISLINILSGREVVPELLQGMAVSKNIIRELKKIMLDGYCRANMISCFRAVRETFTGRRPSWRVAEIISEMAGWKTSRES